MSRPDDFTLPGGKVTFGELRSFFGDEFADQAFGLVERMQAGDPAALGELFDLYFKYEANVEDRPVIALDPQTPKVYAPKPQGAGPSTGSHAEPEGAARNPKQVGR